MSEAIKKFADNQIGFISEEYCGECEFVFDTYNIITDCPDCGAEVVSCNACINCGTKCGECKSGSCFSITN